MSGNIAIKGGGVGPLMANAILNFHFDYLNPSLSCSQLFSPAQHSGWCNDAFFQDTFQQRSIFANKFAMGALELFTGTWSLMNLCTNLDVELVQRFTMLQVPIRIDLCQKKESCRFWSNFLLQLFIFA